MVPTHAVSSAACPPEPGAPLVVRTALVRGTILRRYQRFLAEVRLDDGQRVTAHCTNTGSMQTCWEVGDEVLLEEAANPARKLRYTWLACRRAGSWVGVETGMPNRVVYEAAVRGVLPGLPGLSEVRREVAYGAEKSRIDVYGRDPQGRAVYIEAKNTTLREGAWGLFPDAVTARGAKHLRELRKVAAAGEVAVAAFFVHRSDVTQFDTAREIDAVYAEELDLAAADGVRVLPLQVGLEASLSAESASGERWQLTWTSCGLLPWVRR